MFMSIIVLEVVEMLKLLGRRRGRLAKLIFTKLSARLAKNIKPDYSINRIMECFFLFDKD